MQIEEARRREQADKIAAINALERQSKEIMRHKQVTNIVSYMSLGVCWGCTEHNACHGTRILRACKRAWDLGCGRVAAMMTYYRSVCMPPAEIAALPWCFAAMQVMAQLQSRITSMQSQLLIGGQKVEDLPQFRSLQGPRPNVPPATWVAAASSHVCF